MICVDAFIVFVIGVVVVGVVVAALIVVKAYKLI